MKEVGKMRERITEIAKIFYGLRFLEVYGAISNDNYSQIRIIHPTFNQKSLLYINK